MYTTFPFYILIVCTFFNTLVEPLFLEAVYSENHCTVKQEGIQTDGLLCIAVASNTLHTPCLQMINVKDFKWTVESTTYKLPRPLPFPIHRLQWTPFEPLRSHAKVLKWLTVQKNLPLAQIWFSVQAKKQKLNKMHYINVRLPFLKHHLVQFYSQF